MQIMRDLERVRGLLKCTNPETEVHGRIYANERPPLSARRGNPRCFDGVMACRRIGRDVDRAR